MGDESSGLGRLALYCGFRVTLGCVCPQHPKALPTPCGRTARKFGDATNPLLVSVRSGARASMPGMMDTAAWLPNRASGF